MLAESNIIYETFGINAEKTYQLTKYTEHSNQCKENTIKLKRKASQLGISAQDLAFEFDYALLLMPKMSVHMVY